MTFCFYKAIDQLLLMYNAGEPCVGNDCAMQNSAIDQHLLEAAHHGCESVIELLLSRKANPNSQNRMAQPALWLACSAGHVGVTQLLVRSGANVNGVEQWRPVLAAFKRVVNQDMHWWEQECALRHWDKQDVLQKKSYCDELEERQKAIINCLSKDAGQIYIPVIRKAIEQIPIDLVRIIAGYCSQQLLDIDALNFQDMTTIGGWCSCTVATRALEMNRFDWVTFFIDLGAKHSLMYLAATGRLYRAYTDPFYTDPCFKDIERLRTVRFLLRDKFDPDGSQKPFDMEPPLYGMAQMPQTEINHAIMIDLFAQNGNPDAMSDEIEFISAVEFAARHGLYGTRDLFMLAGARAVPCHPRWKAMEDPTRLDFQEPLCKVYARQTPAHKNTIKSMLISRAQKFPCLRNVLCAYCAVGEKAPLHAWLKEHQGSAEHTEMTSFLYHTRLAQAREWAVSINDGQMRDLIDCAPKPVSTAVC